MEAKPNLVAQYQTLLTVWAALLVSQVMFIVILFLIKGELFEFRFDQPVGGRNGIVTLALAIAVIACVAISFVIKRRFIERAVVEQKVELVQTGMINALALCEASSLIGLFLAFAYDYQYFFAFFALGIFGALLHIPKQEDILAAGYKK
jgi:hypothetical protein